MCVRVWVCVGTGYADPGSMAGSDWNPRGSVRMSTMKRTSIPSFATLHEVSNVDEAQTSYNDGNNNDHDYIHHFIGESS